MIPATWVPWPPPMSVFWYGPGLVGDDDPVARVGRHVGVLGAVELDVVDDVVGQVGVAGIAARVDDGDGHALAGEARRRAGGAAPIASDEAVSSSSIGSSG